MRPLALVVTTAVAAVLAGHGLAGADATAPPTSPPVDLVHIELTQGRLRFVAPRTVTEGDYLAVVNDTKPAQVGPHTFSLVARGSIPKTRSARDNCFTPRHICMAIARWHGVEGEGPPTVNPVDVGAAGWSTMGSLAKEGDSWFTGRKPRASIVEQVLANPGTEPKPIYFMCAIHPWMHGRITVLPAG